jgi:hypothetical protein
LLTQGTKLRFDCRQASLYLCPGRSFTPGVLFSLLACPLSFLACPLSFLACLLSFAM